MTSFYSTFRSAIQRVAIHQAALHQAARVKSTARGRRLAVLAAVATGCVTLTQNGCDGPAQTTGNQSRAESTEIAPPSLHQVTPVSATRRADFHGRVQLPPTELAASLRAMAQAGAATPLESRSNVSEQLAGPEHLTWVTQTGDPPSVDAKPVQRKPAQKKPAKQPSGRFDGPIDLSEVNLDEDIQSKKSLSDRGKIELVPTPIPQKEIVAEIVPTPLGLPEIDPRETQVAGVPGFGMVENMVFNRPATDSAGSDLDDETPDSSVADGPPTSDLALNSADSGIANSDAIETIQGAGAGPEDFRVWPEPAVTLFVTGQQHGYIEPCGCTGLENQKGGVARRMTFLKQLRENGWEMAPIDAGNLVRRYGRQSEIKFHRSLEALRTMGYVSVGLGPDDVRLSVSDLILEASPSAAEDAVYVSANVIPLDRSLMPTHRVVRRGGMVLGVTTVLDPDSLEAKLNDDIQLTPPIDSAKDALAEIQTQNPDFTVLTFYGSEESAHELVRAVPGFDLIVIAGGYGEPTYQPQAIQGSQTKSILTGDKGMYAGLVGLYPDAPYRYARVPLTHEFEDAREMRDLMKEYQEQLRSVGLDGLGLKPIKHPSGDEFVGAEACGQCHTTAYDIWQGSAHFDATEHLVHPGERGDVSRHFDPECLSCHVTGWNPQGYYPYVSGYLELEASSHLHGNGCENCHGPGAAHTKAEQEDSGVSDEEKARLRQAMQLPLDQARETCMKCHDLDNSPDFHVEGAFEDYWAEVEHYGVD